MSRDDIGNALRGGLLVRARRDVYLSAECAAAVRAAQRVGGRLDCVSVLESRGIFVLEKQQLHVQIPPSHSRLRSPRSRNKRLARRDDVTVHWRDVDADPVAHSVPLTAALAQAVVCQPPRAAVAMIDSALFLGAISESDLPTLFAMLPQNRHFLRGLIDGRAEAGSETIARLLLRNLGLRVEVQKKIAGVGRVDVVVEGWLVVECDSREFHSGWTAQEKDRARDLALAARGYTCIRVTARTIFSDPEVLIAAVRGLLAARP